MRRCARAPTSRALYELTHIKPWFIRQMRELVELEEEILKYRGEELPDELLRRGQEGRFCRPLSGEAPGACRKTRSANAARSSAWSRPGKPVPVSGVENAAYYYSTYNAPDRVPVSDRKKIMVLGGGPNRIGQGIEFDYCCVHAAFAMREAGL